MPNNQLLINKCESLGLNYFDNHKDFSEYSSNMDDIYKNIDEYNPNKKRKALIVFDDMIDYVISNKKINSVVIIKTIYQR